MSMPTQELAQKILDIICFNQTEYGEYNVPDIIALLDLERPTPKPETDEDARKLADKFLDSIAFEATPNNFKGSVTINKIEFSEKVRATLAALLATGDKL